MSVKERRIKKATLKMAEGLILGFEDFNEQIARLIDSNIKDTEGFNSIVFDDLESVLKDSESISVPMSDDTLSKLAGLRVGFESLDSVIYRVVHYSLDINNGLPVVQPTVVSVPAEDQNHELEPIVPSEFNSHEVSEENVLSDEDANYLAESFIRSTFVEGICVPAANDWNKLTKYLLEICLEKFSIHDVERNTDFRFVKDNKSNGEYFSLVALGAEYHCLKLEPKDAVRSLIRVFELINIHIRINLEIKDFDGNIEVSVFEFKPDLPESKDKESLAVESVSSNTLNDQEPDGVLELIEVTEETSSSLIHTKISSLSIDGHERRFKHSPKWNDAVTHFYQLALLTYSHKEVSAFTDSILSFNSNDISGKPKIVNERTKLYSQSHSAVKSARIMFKIAQKLGINFNVNFSWRDKGIYPNKFGKIDFDSNDKREVIDITIDSVNTLSYSRPKNCVLNGDVIEGLQLNWADLLERTILLASKKHSVESVLNIAEVNYSRENHLSGSVYIEELGVYMQRCDAIRTGRALINLAENFNLSIEVEASWSDRSDFCGKKGLLVVKKEDSNSETLIEEDEDENIRTVDYDDTVLIEWSDKKRDKIKVDSNIGENQPTINVGGISVIGAHTPLAKAVVGISVGSNGEVVAGNASRKFTIIDILNN